MIKREMRHAAAAAIVLLSHQPSVVSVKREIKQIWSQSRYLDQANIQTIYIEENSIDNGEVNAVVEN